MSLNDIFDAANHWLITTIRGLYSNDWNLPILTTLRWSRFSDILWNSNSSFFLAIWPILKELVKWPRNCRWTAVEDEAQPQQPIREVLSNIKLNEHAQLRRTHIFASVGSRHHTAGGLQHFSSTLVCSTWRMSLHLFSSLSTIMMVHHGSFFHLHKPLMSVNRVAVSDSSKTLSIRCDPLPLLMHLVGWSQLSE